MHSGLVSQGVSKSDVYDPGTRKSVAVPPATAVQKVAKLDDLDFEEGQPVLRMSDLKMPAEMDLELIPSDYPKADTIFRKKFQMDVRYSSWLPVRGSGYFQMPGQKLALRAVNCLILVIQFFKFSVEEKSKKSHSFHVSSGLHEKHSSCSTIFLDGSTICQPNPKITMQCLGLAIYYHIKNRDTNRSKDIFEEPLHPLTEESVPEEYFYHNPDPESIYRFIYPIFTAFKLTGEFAITTLVYIERLVIYAEIDISPTNWKRVVLGAILLSSKYLDDLAIWNVHFCRIIKGLTLKDLNELERQYIYLLQFNLCVSTSVYAKYYFDLRSLASYHGLPVVLAPLRRERAQKLEAISRYCENPSMFNVDVKKSSSCDNFTDMHHANAILS
ncbi:cyclin-Y-like protein 1 [Molossus molossus]|uniref:cyclin-Y-like protein 1 n=1 Tax=Molossus molossus TaxID=27622 RepID=UPI001747449A|nr:cyclin-Y-like protein 1 [Molossus molossus]